MCAWTQAPVQLTTRLRSMIGMGALSVWLTCWRHVDVWGSTPHAPTNHFATYCVGMIVPFTKLSFTVSTAMVHYRLTVSFLWPAIYSRIAFCNSSLALRVEPVRSRTKRFQSSHRSGSMLTEVFFPTIISHPSNWGGVSVFRAYGKAV